MAPAKLQLVEERAHQDADAAPVWAADYIPALGEAYAPYAEAGATLAHLKKLLGTVEARIVALLSTLNARPDDGAPVSKQAARVQQLLGGSAPPPRATAGDLANEYHAALEERRAINEALEIQSRVLAEHRAKASTRVCDHVQPYYRALVRDMADKLAAAHEAHLAYVRFTDALSAGDVAWSMLIPAHPYGLGDPRDPESRLMQWFADSYRDGLLPLKALPPLAQKNNRVQAALAARKPGPAPGKRRAVDLDGDDWG